MNQEEVSKLINLIFDIAFRKGNPFEIISKTSEFPKEYWGIIMDTVMSRKELQS